MIIQAFGDIHARETNPRIRKDNYLQTLIMKLANGVSQASKLTTSEKILILPGDIFDNCRASYFLISQMAGTLGGFKKKDYRIMVVAGQHDQRYHTHNLGNTPLFILVISKIVELLGSIPCIIENRSEKVAFYGDSWGEEIPKIKDPDNFNVLVTHRMVIKDFKLWSQQSEYSYSRALLRHSGFDLIISGDNHGRFIDTYNDKTLINPGSVMRIRKDQVDHKPAMYTFDTKTREAKEILLPIKPFGEVANLEEEEEIEDINQRAEDFANALNDDSEEMELDFVSNLFTYMDKNQIREGIQKVIKESLAGEEI